MELISQLLVSFLDLTGVVALFQGVDFSALTGWTALFAAIFPTLLIAEACFLLYVYRKAPSALSRAFRLPLGAYAVHAVLGAFIYVAGFAWPQAFFSKYAPFLAPMNVIGFLYAYVVWELSHFIAHWSCHKVRILWCLHAPHHAPQHMNLTVFHSTFLYHGTYMTFVHTAVCTALGVPLPMLVLVMAIDGCWGGLIHVSEEAWKSGRLPGVLGRVLLTPSHHRVHHACNPEYIDKNYCNALPLWDKVFGTFQEPIEAVRPRYGITRSLRPGSFSDFYVGEFALLIEDIIKARSVKDALLYVVMPPGWKPQPLPGPAAQVQTKT